MIYTVIHTDLPKEFKLSDGYIWTRVHVTDHNDPEKYLYTDTLDNIDNKNPNYCELTAMYWIWKNSKEDYVGLNHYRRRFIDTNGNVVPEVELKNILNTTNCDMITKPAWNTLEAEHKTVVDTFNTLWTYKKDLDTVFNITTQLYPEYKNDIAWFKKQNLYYNCNIIYCKKELYDRYCNWLFSILFEAEKQLDSRVKTYTLPQSRIYGYMAELLFNIYIHHNNLKVYPHTITDQAKISKIPSIGKNKPKKEAKKDNKVDSKSNNFYLYF